MLASFPASMLNQKIPDLGILNRFKLEPSRSRCEVLIEQASRNRWYGPYSSHCAISGSPPKPCTAILPKLG